MDQIFAHPSLEGYISKFKALEMGFEEVCGLLTNQDVLADLVSDPDDRELLLRNIENAVLEECLASNKELIAQLAPIKHESGNLVNSFFSPDLANFSTPPDFADSIPPPDSVNSIPPPDSVNSIPPPDSVNSIQPPDSVNSIQPPDSVNSIPPPDSVNSIQPPTKRRKLTHVLPINAPKINLELPSTSHQVISSAKISLPFIDYSEEESYNIKELPPSKIKEIEQYIFNILNQTWESGVIYKNYIAGVFDNRDRKKLSDYIVSYQLNNFSSGRITPAEFRTLALGIEAVFPTETALTYYIPQSRSSEGKKVHPAGKLYQSYQYKLRVLSRCENGEASKAAPIKTQQGQQSQKPSVKATEEETRALRFVLYDVEPYEVLEKNWILSYRLRQGTEAIHDYLKKYPALGTGVGGKLLAADFKILYPGKCDLLFEKWPELCDSIISKVETRMKSEHSFKKFISSEVPSFSIIRQLSREERYFHCLALLTYLFSATTKIDKKRFSRKDIKEDFFMHISLHSEKRAELQRRNNRYARKKEHIQPVPIFVGRDINALTRFVEIDNVTYTVHSVLEAIDLCFKAFMALNAKYPPVSAKVWLFLQRYVYGITTKEDKITSDIVTLAVDLNLSKCQ